MELTSLNDDLQKSGVEDIEATSKSDATKKKGPSRSARRKANKRRWRQKMAKIKEKNAITESGLMDCFVMPPFESTCILKDNDIVRKKKHRYDAVEKLDEQTKKQEDLTPNNKDMKNNKGSAESSEDNHITHVTKKNDELQKRGVEDIEATSKSDTTMKKGPSRSTRRKANKRRWLQEIAQIKKKNAITESEGLMDCFVLPPFESTCILKDNDIFRKKKHRYDAVEKLDEQTKKQQDLTPNNKDMKNNTGSAESSEDNHITHGTKKSDELQKSVVEYIEATSKSDTTKKKGLSRSARRKAIKRWWQEMAEFIWKNAITESSGLDVNKRMMNQGSATGTMTTLDPTSLENHQVVDANQHHVSSYYAPPNSTAVPWSTHGTSHSGYDHVQRAAPPSGNVQDELNGATSATTPSSGATNVQQDYSGDATYQNTDPYGYNNTGYAAHYNDYQQRSNQSYCQPSGAYQNTCAPYQPLSSFQNIGSYAGPASYSSTYYNPGDYQTSGGYASGAYNNQTNAWNKGQYATYTSHQYPSYSTVSTAAYSSTTTPAASQYQQHYKQWAEYYNHTQTDVTCAPGTENISVSSVSSMSSPIPAGYSAPSNQAPSVQVPLSYVPPSKPESGLSEMSAVQVFPIHAIYK